MMKMAQHSLITAISTVMMHTQYSIRGAKADRMRSDLSLTTNLADCANRSAMMLLKFRAQKHTFWVSLISVFQKPLRKHLKFGVGKIQY